MKEFNKLADLQKTFDDLNEYDYSILEEEHSYSEQGILGAFKSSHKKINASVFITFVNGFIAGIFIAIGYIAAITGMLGISTAGPKAMVFGLIFTVAITLITFIGGGLYTSHCVGFLNVVKGYDSPKLFIRNLAVMLGSNFVGTFVGAVIFYVAVIYGHDFKDGGIIQETIHMTFKKMGMVGSQLENGLMVSGKDIWVSFINAFASAIFCNLLVASTLYLTYATKNPAANFLTIFLIIFAFAIGGFQHVVANSFPFWINVLTTNNPQSTGYFLLVNIIPSLIGNFIGGGIILPFAGYFLARKKIDALGTALKREKIYQKIKFLQIELGYAKIVDGIFQLNQEKYLLDLNEKREKLQK